MEPGTTWLDALLWSDSFASSPPLETTTDKGLTARLVSGSILDVEVTVRALGHDHGVRALIGGALLPSHPMASALAQWMVSFGRAADAPDVLASRLQVQREGDLCATVLLRAVALGTEERHDEAIALVSNARRPAKRLDWFALSTQLSARYADAGQDADSAAVCQEILERADGTDRTEPYTWVAMRTLQRVTSVGSHAELGSKAAQLWRAGHSPFRDYRRAVALAGLMDDVVRVQLAPPAGAGTRTHWLDTNLFGLLGVWLQRELWGDVDGSRGARAELGLYAVGHTLLPFPAGWTHNVADVSDLDLIRRSGKEDLTGQVVRRWWSAGPLEALQILVDQAVSRPWSSVVTLSSLAVLKHGGDLVTPGDATALIRRLVDVGNATAGDFSPPIYAARAMALTLAVADQEGQEQVLAAVRSWVEVGEAPSVFEGTAARIRYERMGSEAIKAAMVWATELFDGDGDSVRLGAEALLAMSRVNGPAASVAIRDGFTSKPSLERAATMLRMTGVTDADRAMVLLWLEQAVAEREGARSRWSPHHLIAAAADDGAALELVRQHLSDEGLELRSKTDTLVQLAARPAIARQVMDPEMVALLQRQVGPHALWPGDSEVDWAWTAAAMAGAAVSADWALDWITSRLARSPQQQWAAARVLGPAVQVVPMPEVLAAWAALVGSADVEVAAEAARQSLALMGDAPAAMDDPQMASGKVRAGLAALLRRDGSLGPLTAGYALTELGLLDADGLAILRSHPSGSVREIVGSELG